MIELNGGHIRKACRAIAEMVAHANWTFKQKQVLLFEFADMKDFYAARMDIEAALEREHMRQIARHISSQTLEFDCYGITIRLTCHQRGVKPDGTQFGAAEARFIQRKGL